MVRDPVTASLGQVTGEKTERKPSTCCDGVACGARGDHGPGRLTSTRRPKEREFACFMVRDRRCILVDNRLTAPSQVTDGQGEVFDWIAEWRIDDALWCEMAAIAGLDKVFWIISESIATRMTSGTGRRDLTSPCRSVFRAGNCHGTRSEARRSRFSLAPPTRSPRN